MLRILSVILTLCLVGACPRNEGSPRPGEDHKPEGDASSALEGVQIKDIAVAGNSFYALSTDGQLYVKGYVGPSSSLTEPDYAGEIAPSFVKVKTEQHFDAIMGNGGVFCKQEAKNFACMGTYNPSRNSYMSFLKALALGEGKSGFVNRIHGTQWVSAPVSAHVPLVFTQLTLGSSEIPNSLVISQDAKLYKINLYSLANPFATGKLVSEEWRFAATDGSKNFVISTTGDLYAFGYNAVPNGQKPGSTETLYTYGILGTGNSLNEVIRDDKPELVQGGLHWEMVSTRGGATYGITTDAKLYRFGVTQWDAYQSTVLFEPVEIGQERQWSYVTNVGFSGLSAIAIDSDGKLFAIGENPRSLGVNSDAKVLDKMTPVDVQESFVKIVTVSYLVLGLTTTGQVYAWGQNDAYGILDSKAKEREIIVPHRL